MLPHEALTLTKILMVCFRCSKEAVYLFFNLVLLLSNVKTNKKTSDESGLDRLKILKSLFGHKLTH